MGEGATGSTSMRGREVEGKTVGRDGDEAYGG